MRSNGCVAHIKDSYQVAETVQLKSNIAKNTEFLENQFLAQSL